MDPAPSRLATIHTLDHFFEEAGVHTPLREGVMGAFGHPTTVREMAFISEEDWQVLVSTLTCARLTAGLPVERERPPPEASAAPQPPSKRVRLSSLVDSPAEAELVNLDSSVVRSMFSSYKDKRGAFSHKDHEPTEVLLHKLFCPPHGRFTSVSRSACLIVCRTMS